jgi:hypothetical protein
VTLGGIMDALGLGAARDARELVARLPRANMAVVTLDETVARALERTGHRVVAADGEAALALALPAGDEGFERLARLVRATSAGARVIVLSGGDRARDAGLLLRARLSGLRQDEAGGSVYTSGEVGEP